MSTPQETRETLRKEASEVIETTNILEVLTSFGEAEIVGSFTLDLMAWPDIDIHVYVPELTEDTALAVHKSVFELPEIRRAEIIHGSAVKPGILPVEGAFYIRTAKRTAERKWNFDIWLFPFSKDKYNSKIPEDWAGSLSEDDKNTIVAKKLELIERNEYHPGSSLEIYKDYF